MTDIKLYWVTDAQNLGNLTEGDRVDTPIHLRETIEQIGSIGQLTVELGDALERVLSVHLDGVETPFRLQRDDRTVYWDAPLTKAVPVRVELTPAATLVLLSGTLPPGLSLSRDGRIHGVVSNITTDRIAARFTVRARNATTTIDRTFTMTASGVDEPAAFSPGQLVPQATDPVHGFAYRDLGAVAYGQGFAFGFDIRDADGVFPRLVVHKVTGFQPGETKYGGLPEGLALTGLTIQGAISPETCPGEYFFDVVIADPTAPSSARFRITVPEMVAERIGVVPRVDWDTPAGSLGAIEETEPCYFSVQAHAIEAPQVVYSVAPTSAALPSGIVLNPTTGRLYGTFPFVDSTTVFSFTLRASAGVLFTDRTFSITVHDWFDLKSTHQVRLRVRILDDALLVPFYKRTIPARSIYRSEDQNFGFITHPHVYMINGLDGSIPITEAFKGQGVPTMTNTDYAASFRLILGEHKVAVARDSSGRPVYEMLYRDLYDPLDRAGGFTVSQNQPIRQNLLWPQSAATPRYIMPNSVANMRTDMIMDIGLAMTDPAARTLLGPQTHELMPLWMRSVQANGQPLGFRPVLILAYLVPGAGTSVLDQIAANAGAAVPNGHVYHFDRFYLTVSQNIGSTDQSVHLE